MRRSELLLHLFQTIADSYSLQQLQRCTTACSKQHMCGHLCAMTLLAFAEELEKESCEQFGLTGRHSRQTRWASILQETSSPGVCIQANTIYRGPDNIAQQICNVYSQLSTHIHASNPLQNLQVGFYIALIAFEQELTSNLSLYRLPATFTCRALHSAWRKVSFHMNRQN